MRLSSGQTSQKPSLFKGEAVFARLVKRAAAEKWKMLPIGEVMGKIAIDLLDTPYVANTLDVSDDSEVCVIDLDGLDCVTLFECCLDLARVIKTGSPTRARFLDAVRFSRYRNGIQGDFTSRLHYTTDWIWDNAKKRVVRDITSELPGALPFLPKVGTMSSKPSAYRQLRAHPEWIPEIKQDEERINLRSYCYLPMDKVLPAEPLLKTGDIIGITTSHSGIDIAHTGLCYRDAAGVLHFLDASSKSSKMKVTLDPELSAAIGWSRSNTGLMVARPLEP